MEKKMGIAEKLAKAKKTDWLAEGLSDLEVENMIRSAKISARLERYRHTLHMSQKEFAVYMGVPQEMVAKWESREYDFPHQTLHDICQKLNLEFPLS